MNPAFKPTYPQPDPTLKEIELRDMGIMKQAVLKSLIEAGVVKERTDEAEKIVMDWIHFLRRNNEPEWKAWRTNDPDVNPLAEPF